MNFQASNMLVNLAFYNIDHRTLPQANLNWNYSFQFKFKIGIDFNCLERTRIRVVWLTGENRTIVLPWQRDQIGLFLKGLVTYFPTNVAKYFATFGLFAKCHWTSNHRASFQRTIAVLLQKLFMTSAPVPVETNSAMDKMFHEMSMIGFC